MAVPSFDEWLEDALTDGKAGSYVDDSVTVNGYAMRFNLEIADIVSQHGEDRVNKAIWYIYGSASGYMWDAMEKSLGPKRGQFMESVNQLYANGFVQFCSNYYGHLDSGPENARPLNSACYMLWDMDGLECPAINGDTDLLTLSIDVLSNALRIDSIACNESALHGLGHLATSHRALTSPPINEFLRRRNLPPEIREYAEAAKAGYVL